MIHVEETLAGPSAAFADRRDAGTRLAAFLVAQKARPDVVYAVPSGGVAVGEAVCGELHVPLELVLVRKLPFPQNPEAGFGAISLRGETVLNDDLVTAWRLSPETVSDVAAGVLEELRERERKFIGSAPRGGPAGRRCLVVDDGLAAGSTMKAALKELRHGDPGHLAVAVPCAPARTLEDLDGLADDIYCLVAQGPGSFAVASFYRRWHDLTDSEVLALLDRP
jgi:predicted phosphoribosyltransferase